MMGTKHHSFSTGGSSLTTYLVLASVAFALAACGRTRATNQPAAAANQAPKDYRVMAVEPRPITLYIDLPATVVGKQNVEIRPMIDGYIEAIFVDEGAWVAAGQRLFRIKAPQYEQQVRTAEAGIKTAAAEVSSARMAVEKIQPLVAKQIISEYEIQEAQYTLQAKEAALAQAQATLANARTNLSYTSISSPSAGVIGTLPFKIGSLVTTSMADPLTTVSNIEEVHAYFAVNEKIVLSMTRDIAGNTFQEKLAKMPEVTFIMADGRPHEFKGHVQAATGLINAETGSSTFRATFANPRGLLRSGASGQVRVPRPLPSALLVPQSASYELQGKRFVYVVGANDKIRAVEVTTRPTPDGQFFVVDAGLKQGERVVLEGLTSLKDGTVIHPIPAQVDITASAR